MIKFIFFLLLFSVQFTYVNLIKAQDKNSREQTDTALQEQKKDSWMRRMYENITKEKNQGDSIPDSNNFIGEVKDFVEIKSNELLNFIGKKVVINGTPVVIKNEYFLILSDKKLIQINSNTFNQNEDALKTKSALALLVEKGEKVPIFIYGIAASQHALEGRYLEINKKMYEMYWNKISN